MAQDLCNKHQRQKDLGNASVSWRHCSLVVKFKGGARWFESKNCKILMQKKTVKTQQEIADGVKRTAVNRRNCSKRIR
jgi:hypothetical protein